MNEYLINFKKWEEKQKDPIAIKFVRVDHESTKIVFEEIVGRKKKKKTKNHKKAFKNFGNC